jgi:hypothetical protein
LRPHPNASTGHLKGWTNAGHAFAIWNSYAVRAWPTIVLIDKKGIIRYSHIGEGAYEQTQSMIAKLLAEAA